MAHHITRRTRGIPDRKLMHPYREWFIGLSVALVIIVSGAIYNAFVFNHYNSLEDSIEGSQSNSIPYRNNVVSRVLEMYTGNAAMYNTLRESAPETTAQTTTDDTTAEDASTATPEGELRVE